MIIPFKSTRGGPRYSPDKPPTQGRFDGQQQPALTDAQCQHRELWWKRVAHIFPRDTHHAQRMRTDRDQANQQRKATESPGKCSPRSRNLSITPGVTELVYGQPNESVVEPPHSLEVGGEEQRVIHHGCDSPCPEITARMESARRKSTYRLRDSGVRAATAAACDQRFRRSSMARDESVMGPPSEDLSGCFTSFLRPFS